MREKGASAAAAANRACQSLPLKVHAAFGRDEEGSGRAGVSFFHGTPASLSCPRGRREGLRGVGRLQGEGRELQAGVSGPLLDSGAFPP